jgi:hypothetical protein
MPALQEFHNSSLYLIRAKSAVMVQLALKLITANEFITQYGDSNRYEIEIISSVGDLISLIWVDIKTVFC